ncbi:MAG: hypothetical protein ABI415_01025 [Flavitalea sp.]
MGIIINHIQLDQDSWQGLHGWDLVQPIFMFIVGVAMPSLCIYLFVHAGGRHLPGELEKPILYRFFGSNEQAMQIATVLTVSMVLWYICYFLYKKKVFIRI